MINRSDTVVTLVELILDGVVVELVESCDCMLRVDVCFKKKIKTVNEI